MSSEKKRQLLLTAVYLVLIALFTLGGLWFRSHPLFSGQGPRWRSETEETEPEATYTPYEAAAYADKTGTAAAPAALAEPVVLSRFYTVQRAVAFTFSGLGGGEELRGVLDALEKTGSRATFFVTTEELANRQDEIGQIVKAGHELGVSVVPSDNMKGNQLQKDIQTAADALRGKYQAKYEIFVRPAYGSGSAILQAAAACGLRVLTEMKEAVPEKVSRMTDAEEVLAAVISENEGNLQRGEIVHFQMGLFQYSQTVLGELVEAVVTEKCDYPVLPAAEIAKDRREQYVYPVPDDQILPQVKDKIFPGHLIGLSDDEKFTVIRKGYIGINWVVSTYFLPGFSEWQAGKLDKTGLIENDQNYVFLTFDDWGTDGTVDKLLSVLEKHDATATFFVKSEHVPSNPNLLRAIAAAGHTVGAHTFRHIPISNEVYPTYFEELNEEQRQALEDDLVQCYNTMVPIIGDMLDADGKPSLSLLFRPPTLAVGRNGLETVFDCGYTHCISGNYTSTDYKAESAEALAAELRDWIKPGAVIVMHFSDNARYTADALDMLLTEYEVNGSGYRFVGLNKVF